MSEEKKPGPKTGPKTTSIKDAVKESKKKPIVPAKQEEASPFNLFRRQLTKYDNTIIKLCSEDNGLNKEKFMAVAENAVRRNPKLLQADRSSLFGSILTAAEFGLEPNTPAQHSFLIPYWNADLQLTLVEFQLGYHGIVNLLYRHPRIKKVIAELVYYKDKFRRYMDDTMNWRFEFEPAPDDDRKDRKGVFAVVHLEGAEPAFTYLSAEKIEEIKAKSKSPHTYDPKNDPEGWMWKKAAVRQVSKLIPKGSPAVSNAVNVDSMIEAGATVSLDNNGQVVIHKPKDQGATSKDKLNIVFGKDEVQDAEVVSETENNG